MVFAQEQSQRASFAEFQKQLSSGEEPMATYCNTGRKFTTVWVDQALQKDRSTEHLLCTGARYALNMYLTLTITQQGYFNMRNLRLRTFKELSHCHTDMMSLEPRFVSLQILRP